MTSHRTGDKRVLAEVSLTHPQRGDGRRSARLRISDRASGAQIAELELDPDQFMDLLSGRYVSNVPAEIGSRLDLIGRQHEHHVELVPREVADLIPYQANSYMDPLDAAPEVRAWVDAQRDGWETCHLNRHNTGWALHLDRWTEDTHA